VFGSSDGQRHGAHAWRKRAHEPLSRRERGWSEGTSA
jgi:hypothetical protein